MDLQQIWTNAQDAITVKRVYGDPYEKNGVTVIPAAAIRGGGGGGGGVGDNAQEGMGGGFGVAERPVGAMIIKGDEVRWEPAVDVNRIVLVGGVVAAMLLVLVGRIAKLRAEVRLRA